MPQWISVQPLRREKNSGMRILALFKIFLLASAPCSVWITFWLIT